MFEVQIVRQRRARGTHGGLQALRRRLYVSVSDRSLKIFALPPPSGSVPAERRSAVLTIAQNRITSVRVRGRLLRVVVNEDNALTVRLQDQDEALRAAESMMEMWDIDPLVEDSETPPAEEVECGVGDLARHYMGNPNFRGLVHEIHDQFDKALGNQEARYEARV
ncbi:hypothetical protein PF005_g5893 [Phytophthora fragariae]|uniref:Uncharacterized protein n=2 Tax=Phytophthora TaxID=4783 RepID=A0A6A3FHK7_9STRA|nr:hypothetical protein PF003_g13433 [Phytophthora fragariae]KAE9344352.1 hypothetical protein PR003_g8512 [Phytophthora rubi]KAE8943891.1 hypothetical protein PF009_g6411 [Phytophthora fragariae]KAE9020835.1 hypothetical protein PF011_g5214 [Phytophthora fragariae]KAE9130011.1 hypothetical protein PF010_g3992 [Phytophthora fragariae]